MLLAKVGLHLGTVGLSILESVYDACAAGQPNDKRFPQICQVYLNDVIKPTLSSMDGGSYTCFDEAPLVALWSIGLLMVWDDFVRHHPTLNLHLASALMPELHKLNCRSRISDFLSCWYRTKDLALKDLFPRRTDISHFMMVLSPDNALSSPKLQFFIVLMSHDKYMHLIASFSYTNMSLKVCFHQVIDYKMI